MFYNGPGDKTIFPKQFGHSASHPGTLKHTGLHSPGVVVEAVAWVSGVSKNFPGDPTMQ